MSVITDAVVAIQRLTKDSDDTDKEQYQVNEALKSVKCQIQPAAREDTEIVDGVFAQTNIMFTSYSGLQVGDKVTVSGTGQVYKISGIEDWSMDPMPHYEIKLLNFEEERI